MKTALSIVLPCYNEARNLPLLFSRFTAILGTRQDVEVLFVDNGSTDDSAAVLAREMAKPEHAFARPVTIAVNRGYGHGIMQGVTAAASEVIAWTHADLQTDPQDVLDAFQQFAAAAEDRVFLRGRRVGRPLLDAFFTSGMGVIASLALGRRLLDVNAQPKMFRRSFLAEIQSPPADFSLDLYVLFLAAARGYRMLEQPVRFDRRRYGEAKGGGTLKGKLKLIRRTWKYIFELRRKLREQKY